MNDCLKRQGRPKGAFQSADGTRRRQGCHLTGSDRDPKTLRRTIQMMGLTQE